MSRCHRSESLEGCDLRGDWIGTALLVAVALLVAGPRAPLHAQPGVPDPNFNGDGWMPINFGADSALQAVAYVDDGASIGGHLLVGGTAGGARFELRRVLLDGTLDIGFGFLGQIFYDVPDASRVEVVKIVGNPGAPGYLVLLQAVRAGGPVGLMMAIDWSGDPWYPEDGFLDLFLEGPSAATDLELCCRSDMVGISGQNLRSDFEGGWRGLIGSGASVSGPDFGVSGADDQASALTAYGTDELALLWTTQSEPDTVKMRHDTRALNSVGSGEYSWPGTTIEARAASATPGGSAVGASWVTSGATGRPLLLTAFVKTCCNMVLDPNFSGDGVLTYAPQFDTGYDGLRPEEIRHDGTGLVVAATELGSPTGSLRRVRTLRFADDGSLQFEGPGLLGPDSGRDHDVTDMDVLADGRLALTVTTTDRLHPFSAKGWLLVLSTKGLFEDDFESGDASAWSSTSR